MTSSITSVGVPREVKTAEHRVAMTPDGVRELERHGIAVFVETGAGDGASITDDDYVAAGAEIVPTAADAWAQQMVVKVKEPKAEEFEYLRADLTLFTYLHLAAYPAVADALLASGTTSVAHYLDQHPEIFVCKPKEPNFFAFSEGFTPAAPVLVQIIFRNLTDL